MTNNSTVSPLRQRMIEDTVARKLNPHTQRSHIHSCKRFAAYLKRSPDTATPDDVRRVPAASDRERRASRLGVFIGAARHSGGDRESAAGVIADCDSKSQVPKTQN